MIDRSAEVEYLKHMFSVLCKFDFPEQVKCSPLAKSLMAECFALQVMQLSDLISDPDRMNLLIAKILSGAKKMIAGSASPSVPFLYRLLLLRYFIARELFPKLRSVLDQIVKQPTPAYYGWPAFFYRIVREAQIFRDFVHAGFTLVRFGGEILSPFFLHRIVPSNL